MSLTYAAVRFARSYNVSLDDRTNERDVYTSAYQTITGHYDVDFLLKLVAYACFLSAWQIPFICMMWPRVRVADNKGVIRLRHEDPRDSTKLI